MVRPMTGVATSRRSGWRIFPLVAFNVWRAGGQAVRWGDRPPSDLDQVEGIIVGGGDDISPELYGMRLTTSARLDPDRDALEQRLVTAPLERNMPVLGICRGSQMLNVVLGGTLDQDAYGTCRGSRKYHTILPRKSVRVFEGTRLFNIVGGQPVKVNALHSQAVHDLGRDLCVAARDEGGMIQAIERTCDPFAVGVQWHPEHLFYARRQPALFAAHIAAARACHEEASQLCAVDEETKP